MNKMETVTKKEITKIVGGILFCKVYQILERNPGYARMKEVNAALQEEEIYGELPRGLK